MKSDLLCWIIYINEMGGVQRIQFIAVRIRLLQKPLPVGAADISKLIIAPATSFGDEDIAVGATLLSC